MQLWKNKKVLISAIALIIVVFILVSSFGDNTVDFSTQVKPILNKNCISCHGGVKQRGGFSVLFREEALAKTESGKPAIIPGDPGASEMIRRLKEKDPEERMPYKHPPLSKDAIDLLSTWIKQGATWGEHWAYIPVQPVEVPKPKASLWGLFRAPDLEWAKNDIDYFIYDRLKREVLEPSPQADKATLLRRLSLDLTGLPPSADLGKQFLSSTDDNAYEQAVNSLLASPQFGEKWTSLWLDLARYADTKGYERDDSRNIWRYRDWLIHAFNSDKPYDQFLAEQLAGDLMENPTEMQYIATAFHRNTMTNDEGGTDNEEFRTAAAMDRVSATWDGVLSTTFACVQCHSHPYDPFKHEDYYKFLAFFNNSRDEDTYAEYPVLRHYSSKDSSKVEYVTNWLRKNGYPLQAKQTRLLLKTWQPAINSIQADQLINSALLDTKYLGFRNNGSARLKGVNLEQKSRLIYRYNSSQVGGKWTIRLDKPNGPVLTTISISPVKEWTIAQVDFPQAAGVHDLFFSYSNPNLKLNENGLTFDWFHFTQPLPGKGLEGYARMEKTFWQLLKLKVEGTPIMLDNPADMQRTTNIFERGNWLVKGKEVKPDVPESLNPFPRNAPRNRLGLAMWLTSKDNPLTARTMVNRLWEQVYGVGLVETLEDMGTQGMSPSNKELLDYLSYKFMNDYNWSVKKLLKEMVMSATYQQDSKVRPGLIEKDPYNKFLARGPRVRLTGEQVRDQALAVSGLLKLKMYGPGVMPWQPEGIWMSPWNGQTWKPSQGDDAHRRAVYTYWKRTAPYPTMITFDGAGREVCTSRRIRTNTPLQALVTLNDSVFIEASRSFAYRMQHEAIKKNDVKSQISKGYEIMMLKPISAKKLNILEHLYQNAFQKYRKDPGKAAEMMGTKKVSVAPELAALTVVANAMLNLDELITKN
ncbi:DUF1553 domain-containing protein [Daejeonella sp.]|uniref:DUF1553 domain-containing protein n=1 Tax=Daejeonella sp. TaxID=2805397 RepID=UPI003983A209